MRLSCEQIQAALPDVRVEVFPELDSTNAEAKRRLKNGLCEPLLLVAEHQTAGRGRQGRSFYSPDGTGIYMTLVVHPNAPLTDAVSVTTRASVAVCRAIRRLTGLNAEIKWVNDLYYNGKKICGILVEAVSDFAESLTKSLVIGVGVNVTTQDFPKELPEAASLGTAVNRSRLTAAIAEELLRETADLHDKSYLSDYRAWSLVLGKKIVWTMDGVKREALAVEIDGEGGLVIREEDGTVRTLRSGEISVRLNP